MTELSASSKTVLVVDDNAGVLSVVVSMLKSARFEVLSATSGPAALQAASDPSVRIDLVLTDIDMPGMSGPTLALLLLQIRPDVRVIFMSGGNHNFPFAESDDAYIAKPFRVEGLLRKIHETFRRGRPHSVGRGLGQLRQGRTDEPGVGRLKPKLPRTGAA